MSAVFDLPFYALILNSSGPSFQYEMKVCESELQTKLFAWLVSPRSQHTAFAGQIQA